MTGEIGCGLGPACHLQLGEDARYVVLDGFLGEFQVDADLSVRLAFRDLSEDALLLSRESCQPLVAEQVLALAKAVEDAFGNRGIEEVLTGPYGPNSPHQVTAMHLLEDVSSSPSHDRSEERLIIGKGGQHQHLGVGEAGADLPGGVDPAPVREPDIHHHDIGSRPLRPLNGLMNASGLTSDAQALFFRQQRLDPVADNFVIVDDHDPQRHNGLGADVGLHNDLILGFEGDSNQGRRSRDERDVRDARSGRRTLP